MCADIPSDSRKACHCALYDTICNGARKEYGVGLIDQIGEAFDEVIASLRCHRKGFFHKLGNPSLCLFYQSRAKAYGCSRLDPLYRDAIGCAHGEEPRPGRPTKLCKMDRLFSELSQNSCWNNALTCSINTPIGGSIYLSWFDFIEYNGLLYCWIQADTEKTRGFLGFSSWLWLFTHLHCGRNQFILKHRTNLPYNPIIIKRFISLPCKDRK